MGCQCSVMPKRYEVNCIAVIIKLYQYREIRSPLGGNKPTASPAKLFGMAAHLADLASHPPDQFF